MWAHPARWLHRWDRGAAQWLGPCSQLRAVTRDAAEVAPREALQLAAATELRVRVARHRLEVATLPLDMRGFWRHSRWKRLLACHRLRKKLWLATFRTNLEV